ncbi:MAG: ABC transporter permease [Planctomycetaceae bacterium]|nr:ABC transporter permease [Planctomycetaceae bacterium]
MKGKIVGILGLLLTLCLFMTVATADPWWNPTTSQFLTSGNVQNLLSRVSLYGILGIGVAFVIITSGIDLSIGSLVCLSGVLLSLFLHVDYLPFETHPVVSVSKADSSFAVRGNAGSFAPGARFRYVGGKARNRVFTIETVTEDTSTGQVVLVTAETPARDDDSGEIIPVQSVTVRPSDGSHQYSAELRFPAHEGLRIQPRDRLTIVNATDGVTTQDVVNVVLNKAGLNVHLRNDPGIRFSENCSAYVEQRHQRMSVPMALVLVLLIAAGLGLIHGLLSTRARLQPFVVTLCGLLIYRGLSRWLTNDDPAGFGEFQEILGVIATKRLTLVSNANGPVFGIPYPFFFLIVIGSIAAIFLGKTIWGRYLLALGRSETAARYSGINTQRVTLCAYVICSTLAAIGGILFSLDSRSISPSSFGNFFELYAIAAAVLGGCSLRGGEGSIIGVVIGTAVMQVLNNMIMLLGVSQQLEFAIIGLVILLGVLSDEFVRRIAAQRRLAQSRNL